MQSFAAALLRNHFVATHCRCVSAPCIATADHREAAALPLSSALSKAVASRVSL
jgi:hypothetical protein